MEDPVDELDVPRPGNPITEARKELELALRREDARAIAKALDNLVEAHVSARMKPVETDPVYGDGHGT